VAAPPLSQIRVSASMFVAAAGAFSASTKRCAAAPIWCAMEMVIQLRFPLAAAMEFARGSFTFSSPAR